MPTGDDAAKTKRINDLIDSNLKLLYSDLSQEELPARFSELLNVLQDQESKGQRRK